MRAGEHLAIASELVDHTDAEVRHYLVRHTHKMQGGSPASQKNYARS